ncbi:30S ribosome-binding factor RbfA [Buchnera aphidicola]|uniref:Ribosome-binding factor A n=1 Tax=Buchnera aphidicola subsp. Tuberolachnus salignus TaxID=98804 RepID=A0A160SYB1_BUCTT|nr:30S ribosome-binding factor RbfA [Buchnera aphidicola]CUR53224.1 Ribosome-binding factor A [Buchnera aphidicola (Tuberolachnus salignus)]
MLKNFNRAERLGHCFQKELSYILYHNIHDPRLFHKGTITNVSVSRDFKYGKVFIILWSLQNKKKISQYLKILQNASGFISFLLGKRISLRILPKLFFFHDSSFLEGEKISLILKKK